MEEKIYLWAKIWDEKISEVRNGKYLYWFTIESKSILRSSIQMLEKMTNSKVYSIDISEEGKLQVWLEEEV